MLLVIGTLIVVAGFVFLCVVTWHKQITPGRILALGFMGLAAGIVVANISDLAGLVLQLGEKTFYGLQLQRVEQKAKEVKTDADEVRKMKEQIQAIVGRLEKGEQAAQEADKKLKDVQRQQTKRRLSDEQKRILIKALSPFQGQKVFVGHDFRAEDGPELVKDFRDVFVEAKWSLNGDSGTVLTAYEGDPTGIGIRWNKSEIDAGRTSESAKILADVLFQLGMIQKAEVIGSETTPVGQVDVVIGRKP